MKLLLPLVLISLVSCNAVKNPRRPSAEVPNQGAPATNNALGKLSTGHGGAVNSGHDVADDSVAYGGRVATRQARNYTKIGFNSVRRADDLALRESKRYTDYALDTYDMAADQEVKTFTGWSRFGSESAVTAFRSTKKMHQRTLKEHGDAVDRSYFAFWDIVNPPETKPWMVGSKNDCAKYCGGGVRVPGGVWTKDIAFEPVAEEPVSEKNPVRIMK